MEAMSRMSEKQRKLIYGDSGELRYVRLSRDEYFRILKLADISTEDIPLFNPAKDKNIGKPPKQEGKEKTSEVVVTRAPVKLQEILGASTSYKVNDPGESWCPRKKRRTTPGGVSYEDELNKDRPIYKDDLPPTGSTADRIRHSQRPNPRKKKRREK
mgnify:FL=1